VLEGAGYENYGEQDAGHRTCDMGLMVDDAALALALVQAVGQKEETEDDGRNAYGYEEEVDTLEGVEQDEGKQHADNCSRCAQAGVIRIVAMPEQRRDTRKDQAKEVEGDVQPRPDRMLHHWTEEKERDHVEKQVHEVSMQETAGDELVPLPLPERVEGAQHTVLLETGHGRPGQNRGGNGDDDEYDGDRKHGAEVKPDTGIYKT
jgi:hypothetical protein